jgi:hypothetical protein
MSAAATTEEKKVPVHEVLEEDDEFEVTETRIVESL